MKSSHFAALQLLLAIPSASVFAQAASQPSPALSHAQVKAETREAIRVGDFEVGDTGRKAYEVDPSRYPKRLTVPGQTRAQVKAELEAERRNGDIPLSEVGATPRQNNAKAYPAQPATSTLTRAQVRQETRAAIFAGDVQVGETGGTLAQENPSRYAGCLPSRPSCTCSKSVRHRPPVRRPQATDAPPRVRSRETFEQDDETPQN